LEHSAELWIENVRSEGEESAQWRAEWRRQKRMVALEENRVGLGIDFLALPVSTAGHLWLLHSI